MLEASGSLALRTCMGHLRWGALGLCGRRARCSDAIAGDVQGLAHAGGCGSADYVVAIEGCLEGDACKKISIEFHAKLFQFFEREIAKFAAFVEAITDSVADFFVGFAKGYTFVNQICSSGHCI